MKEQKFKRGNLVKVLVGHQIWSNKEGVTDISPKDVGRFAIIDFSYAERYGGNNVDSYSIIWCDTGESLAWKYTHELELIDEGGEYLFEQAKQNREKISKQNTDINYILSKLDEGALSSESILFLFEKLGFESSFNHNGEFFCLFNDWEKLRPAFVHIKNSKTLEEAKSFFTETWLKKFNVEKVFNEFHAMS